MSIRYTRESLGAVHRNLTGPFLTTSPSSGDKWEFIAKTIRKFLKEKIQ